MKVNLLISDEPGIANIHDDVSIDDLKKEYDIFDKPMYPVHFLKDRSSIFTFLIGDKFEIEFTATNCFYLDFPVTLNELLKVHYSSIDIYYFRYKDKESHTLSINDNLSITL